MTMCDKHQFYDRVTDKPCKKCLQELGEYDEGKNLSIPPKRIYLHQPYPDTADFEWYRFSDQLNVDGLNSHLYLRADFIFEVLNDYKKVTDLMDELESTK